MSRPLILVCNDDGVQAPGIARLSEALEQVGDVWIVAPDRERSAASHAITLDRPLRVANVRPQCFAVSGSPADAVYLALLRLLPDQPKLVVSGINNGFNLGTDVFYSGTVAAAAEGALRGVPSVAISVEWQESPDFSWAAAFAAELARGVIARGLPPRTLLNVNVGACRPHGWAWTRLGRRIYRDQVEERTDLRGKTYYWIGGPAIATFDEPGTDCEAVQRGLASVTPLELDLTSRTFEKFLEEWPSQENIPSREMRQGQEIWEPRRQRGT